MRSLKLILKEPIVGAGISLMRHRFDHEWHLGHAFANVVPNDRINDGAYYASKFGLPLGSWLNPDDIRTAHTNTWHFLVSAW